MKMDSPPARKCAWEETDSIWSGFMLKIRGSF